MRGFLGWLGRGARSRQVDLEDLLEPLWLTCGDEAGLNGRACCCLAGTRVRTGSGRHAGLCCPDCGPLAKAPTGFMDVLAGYVCGLARNEALANVLPTDRAELLENAGGLAAHATLEAAPDFRLWQIGAGDVELRIGGLPVHVWPAAELEAHAQAARSAWRGRYDGDY